MKYFISYSHYSVGIEENIGLYDYIQRDLGMQFIVSEDESQFKPGIKNWKVKFTCGLIDKYKSLCTQEMKMEHNLGCLHYKCDDFSLFFSLNYDWIVQLSVDSTICLEVDCAKTAYFIMRKILHQISRYEHRMRRHIFLHSSCLVHNNKGYAFIGGKGAGKTTVMMNLLTTGESKYQYLGNDIVVVDNQQRLYAIYSKVGIGAATLEFLNLQRGVEFPIYNKDKFYYDLGDFVKTFDVTCTDSAELVAIFILEDSNSEVFSCSPYEPDVAEQKIYTDVLQDGKQEELSDHPDWLCLMESDSDEIDIGAICKKIAIEIPCYSVCYQISRSEDYLKFDDAMKKA